MDLDVSELGVVDVYHKLVGIVTPRPIAWVTTVDHRTRASHRAAGATYGPNGTPGPIPIGKAFIVGGARLRYPLDPLAPAREVVACRCRQIAIPPTMTEAEVSAIIEEMQRVQETAA